MAREEKKTVLVVDDMDVNRKMLLAILAPHYEVVEADNGISAKGALRRMRGPASLILLDVVMPVMDGIAFAEYLHNEPRYRDIPVIFVTAETYEENILSGIKFGVRDVIAKPFDPGLVLHRVNNLIALAEREQAAAARPEGAETAAEAPPPPAEAAKARPAPRTALIVDDVGINRVILRSALEDAYGILEASNGQEALEALRQHGPEIAVVLLDIIMPVMDGSQMMREAKRENLLGDIPVIAVTAEDSIPKLNRLAELGLCEVIQKPFTPAVVRNRVDYLVKLAQSGGPPCREGEGTDKR